MPIWLRGRLAFRLVLGLIMSVTDRDGGDPWCGSPLDMTTEGKRSTGRDSFGSNQPHLCLTDFSHSTISSIRLICPALPAKKRGGHRDPPINGQQAVGTLSPTSGPRVVIYSGIAPSHSLLSFSINLAIAVTSQFSSVLEKLFQQNTNYFVAACDCPDISVVSCCLRQARLAPFHHVVRSNWSIGCVPEPSTHWAPLYRPKD